MDELNREVDAAGVAEVSKGKKDFSVLDLLQVPACVCGKDQRVIYANGAFAELAGCSCEQIVGRPFSNVIDSEEDAVERALLGENERIISWAMVKNKGKKRYLEYSPTPLRDDRGEIIGVLETILDFTNVELMFFAVQDLVEKAKNGDLQARMEVEAEGSFQDMVNGINKLLDTVVEPLKEASDVLQDLAKGKLSSRVVGDYKGDYAIIKDALNESMEVLQGYIEEIDNVFNMIREQKSLDVEITGEFRGDFQSIKENINNVVIRISRVFTQVNTASDQVAVGSQQVAEASQSLAQGASEAASSLEEIASSVQQLTSQTEQNSENAAQANQMTVSARAVADKGSERMEELLKAMGELNDSSKNIAKIIKAIDEIASQTNLLALNAAVEAARAGKHGKGFTVVAEEVKNLAQRSGEAARETAEMIEDSIEKTEAGNKIAANTATALQEIITEATKVGDLVAEIDCASKEQQQGIREISEAISQLDQVTQEVSASSEESAAASEELSGQANQMRELMSQFTFHREATVVSSELPAGVTPEMLQMLQKMIAEQGTAGKAAGGKQAGDSTGTTAKTKPGKPEKVLAQDDQDFGRF